MNKLDEFKSTPTGAAIAEIMADPANLDSMIGASRRDRPAVEAIGAQIAAAVSNLDDTERKLVGHWVKQVLGPRGWVPDRKGRVARGNLFNRGTIYKPRPREAGESAMERMQEVWALVAALEHPLMSVDEFIAERRRAFERGD